MINPYETHNLAGGDEAIKSERRREMSYLAKELYERGEVFPFCGILEVELSKMRATDEEYPGYTTPIDVIVERMKVGGMRVVPSADLESGNVFVVPAQGEVTEEDMFLFPRQLKIVDGMSGDLKKLIASNLYFFERKSAGLNLN